MGVSMSFAVAPQSPAARLARAGSRALPPGVATVALAIVALNLFDALLTVAHISLGAIELNPLMRHLLEQGPVDFVVVKHLMVGTGVLVIAAHCRRPAALRALRFLVLPAYAMVALYQVALLAFVA